MLYPPSFKKALLPHFLLVIVLLISCTPPEPRKDRRAKKPKQTEQSTPTSPAQFTSLSEQDYSLQSLGMIVGAAFDEESQSLILIGNGEHPEYSPSLQQVAVALQWAYADSANHNFVSIDPISSDPDFPWMKTRINRDAMNTDFGWIMFEADRLMKGYSLGYDNVTLDTLQSVSTDCKSILDIDKGSRKGNVWSRFWLYPRSNKVEATRKTMFIREVSLGVKTEKMRWQGGKLISAVCRMSHYQLSDLCRRRTCFPAIGAIDASVAGDGLDCEKRNPAEY
jgi:hypothetical protein